MKKNKSRKLNKCHCKLPPASMHNFADTSLLSFTYICGGQRCWKVQKNLCTCICLHFLFLLPTNMQRDSGFPLLTEQLGVHRDILYVQPIFWFGWAIPIPPLASNLFSVEMVFNDFAKYSRHREIKLNTENEGRVFIIVNSEQKKVWASITVLHGILHEHTHYLPKTVYLLSNIMHVLRHWLYKYGWN